MAVLSRPQLLENVVSIVKQAKLQGMLSDGLPEA